jgi:hypothetical protein
MTKDDIKKAVDDGFLDAVKDRVKTLATNLLNETPEVADGQFERGMRMLSEAHEEATAIVEKIFTG